VAEVRRVVEAHGARYVRGPRRGLYANRNAVALACRGTHVRTMDDDHEFPPGHLVACDAALAEDPASVWILGEQYPGDIDPARIPDCPGQLTAAGYSATPPDPQDCWAISDGAAIYPRRLFQEGVRYAEAFPFGAAYLELGSRLHWRGQRIRFLDTTYVVHHYDPAARSVMDPAVDLASRTFAALCHAFVYQPSARNRAVCLSRMALRAARGGVPGAQAVAAGWRAFRVHISELERGARG